MFIEPRAQRILKLRRSVKAMVHFMSNHRTLGFAEGTLRSSGAKGFLSGVLNYKHSAALRLLFSAALALALASGHISPRPAGAHSPAFKLSLPPNQDDD